MENDLEKINYSEMKILIVMFPYILKVQSVEPTKYWLIKT